MLTIQFLTAWADSAATNIQQQQAKVLLETTSLASDSTIYKTETLEVHKISDHVYTHISFLQTESFGRVACNGMIIINKKQAVVFDTPADNESAAALIEFVREKLNGTIKAVVATHFHADCIGGLKMFHDNKIPSYANQRTIDILQKKAVSPVIPQNGFEQTLTLAVGSEKVYARYFGEGHTRDNCIGYFPKDKAVFGGCLIKEVGASKGNLEDANVYAWPETVSRLKQKYPDARIVIPGHGKSGGTELFDYTINLFK
jgi:metallo-beta-lactamase class B